MLCMTQFRLCARSPGLVLQLGWRLSMLVSDFQVSMDVNLTTSSASSLTLRLVFSAQVTTSFTSGQLKHPPFFTVTICLYFISWFCIRQTPLNRFLFPVLSPSRAYILS
ncbi:hypothetical protein BDN72DRAFT_344984 [Pluteus cervinus]|uniref:Uncharacterized protein n=1 Tax=Pluteus cervinus TaxID=181527 RepID=A0ACD3B2U1_9AGAR|nr:hypothetical protein BDN72DRAFT_344984 [Pluteus cervinus]